MSRRSLQLHNVVQWSLIKYRSGSTNPSKRERKKENTNLKERKTLANKEEIRKDNCHFTSKTGGFREKQSGEVLMKWKLVFKRVGWVLLGNTPIDN